MKKNIPLDKESFLLKWNNFFNLFTDSYLAESLFRKQDFYVQCLEQEKDFVKINQRLLDFCKKNPESEILRPQLTIDIIHAEDSYQILEDFYQAYCMLCKYVRKEWDLRK